MKIDIANNIKTVELLKVELMQKLTDLFGDIAAETDFESLNRLTDDAAGIINIAYILAMRLGVDLDDLNSAMKQKLIYEIRNNHYIERRYGDLSELYKKLG